MVAMSGTFSTWMWENRPYSIEGSLPFELGKSYPRRDGKLVKIIAINENGECVQGDDFEAPHLGWRYQRAGDRGRCTGSAVDDPGNLLPAFAESVKEPGKGFLIPVSFLGANRPQAERDLFSQLLILEKEGTDIRYAANSDKDWQVAYQKLFGGDFVKRVTETCAALGFDFKGTEPAGRHATDVREFTWALEEFIQDKRAFYHA